MKPPKLDVKVVQALTDDQLRDLIKVCAGKEFQDRRDEAIVRLMAETGMRHQSCAGGPSLTSTWPVASRR